jgi:hypothetical protein
MLDVMSDCGEDVVGYGGYDLIGGRVTRLVRMLTVDWWRF